MKTVNSILFISFIVLSLTSCTKDSESVDQKIVGKWQISEIYNGIAGSPFGWNTIQEQYKYSIQFQEDGSFIKTEAPGNSPSVCTGTYTLTNQNEIILNSVCNNSSEKLNLNLTSKALTITYQVREGEIREKFIKVQ